MPLTTDDTIEILQLYARYNTAIDTGDGKAFGGCFVPEGIFDPGHTRLEGVDSISEFAVQTHETMPRMRHDATNIVVEGDGRTASGSAFLIGYLAAPDYQVIVTGRYVDSLTKTASGWRFVERVFRADQ